VRRPSNLCHRLAGLSRRCRVPVTGVRCGIAKNIPGNALVTSGAPVRRVLRRTGAVSQVGIPATRLPEGAEAQWSLLLSTASSDPVHPHNSDCRSTVLVSSAGRLAAALSALGGL